MRAVDIKKQTSVDHVQLEISWPDNYIYNIMYIRTFYMYIHVHISIYIHTSHYVALYDMTWYHITSHHIETYIHTHTYIYMYIYNINIIWDTHTYICIYIYTYIHTHIPRHLNTTICKRRVFTPHLRGYRNFSDLGDDRAWLVEWRCCGLLVAISVVTIAICWQTHWCRIQKSHCSCLVTP